MAEVTVKQLAKLIGTEVKSLIVQLKDSGVAVANAEDIVTDEQSEV